jgi:hypothetical protein
MVKFVQLLNASFSYIYILLKWSIFSAFCVADGLGYVNIDFFAPPEVCFQVE